MASIKDFERAADDLDKLVDRFRAELGDGPDFDKLIEIADEISEHADNAAATFNSMNEQLTSRIRELSGDRRSASSKSGGAREKVASATG
jgi:hypothetical protein